MKLNCYQILGVRENASQGAIDIAYTELLAKHKALHDQGQETKNELVIIKLAYEVLSNTEKRTAYDIKLETMPVKPRIVYPTPKASSQPTIAGQRENEVAQTGTSTVQVDLKSHTTENEMWAQTILFFVHEPMVAFNVGRYPVSKIINQFPIDEREKVKEGIDAVTELGFFVIDGGDICLTDKGEKLFEVLSHVIQLPATERLGLSKGAPKFAELLTTIQRDSRLTPPSLSANPRKA